MTVAYPVIEDVYPQYAGKYMAAIRKTINSIKEYLISNGDVEEIEGFNIPNWLPYKYASDQASLIIICLSNYYEIVKDEKVLDLINDLAGGIMLMQINDKDSEYNGAFLSWMNIWHAWGNLQSASLLAAYRLTDNPDYLHGALYEIDNFYSYLYKIKYLNDFSLRKENNKLIELERKQYSQIAYGIRPMVFAALEAYDIAGDQKYAMAAANYAGWLFGDNIMNAQIYFYETGVCFDGLNENILNKNSGAESTIEALLLLQEIERYKIAYTRLINYINE